MPPDPSCCPACLEAGEVLSPHVFGAPSHPPCVLPPDDAPEPGAAVTIDAWLWAEDDEPSPLARMLNDDVQDG